MKRKTITVMCVLGMTLTLSACSGGNDVPVESSNTPVVTEAPQKETFDDESSLESILKDIDNEFDTTTKLVTDELSMVYDAVGTSYEEYAAHKQKIFDWYIFAQDESEKLFKRTGELSIQYFKAVSDSVDHSNPEAIDDAMSNFSDRVYAGVFSDYGEYVCGDLLQDIYDKYYDGVIQESADVIEYSELNGVATEFYKKTSDAKTQIYKAWSDSSSHMYETWSVVGNSFFGGNFDVDAILKEKAESTPEAEVPAEIAGELADVSAGVNPQFKETMDKYEVFFDEYIIFMEKYSSSADPTSMLSDYTSYLQRYTDTMKSLEELNTDDLSTEDMLYYTEVSARIYERLAKAVQ